LKTEKDYYQK